MNSQFSVSANVASGWNLVSVPVANGAQSASSAFAGMNGVAYEYVPDSGYLARPFVQSGAGYWTKFNSPGKLTSSGTYVVSDTIAVKAGWNMIGGLSVAAAATDVTSLPSGIVLGPLFYGYDPSAGYGIADELEPFGGYWMKARSDGQVIVKVGDNLLLAKNVQMSQASAECASLLFTDAAGHKHSLSLAFTDKVDAGMFDLPPTPPAGAFDVRYGSQRSLEAVSSLVNDVAYSVFVQSATLPLTVSWNIPASGSNWMITLEDGAGGKYFASKNLAGSGKLTVMKGASATYLLKISSASERPKAYALSQNYPNPFNPTTKISYALPVQSRVSLRIYNILGQQVKTLVDGIESDGYKSIEWNASSQNGLTLPSGVYFYRLEASPVGGSGSQHDFVSVKKLVLMK